jgi:hypothetical protein
MATVRCHFPAGTQDSQRDLAAVGDQYLLEHCHPADHEQRLVEFDWLAVSTRMVLMTPSASASISFINFMASMMQSVSPCLTVLLISMKAGAGAAGAIEGADHRRFHDMAFGKLGAAAASSAKSALARRQRRAHLMGARPAAC